MKKTDIAWAAGLFEGEGTMIVRQPRGRGRFPTVAMRLHMTDRDVVERFASVVGCGKVGFLSRHARNPLHSDTWVWQIGRRAECLRVVLMLLPYLGERRAARAREVIEAASLPDGRARSISRRWQ